MPEAENFLHTTHRTVSWFNKTKGADELELSAPFQRNPVWTDLQKAYLIDTILHGLPIPELYMQDTVDAEGGERHIVVDGQQRIRAVIDFIEGHYRLEGSDITRRWRGLSFEDLGPEEKKTVFGYKFVVRILPEMDEDDLRKIFARLNRNVVVLNEQELRNATYWGTFIKLIQKMADEFGFWAESGLFSANDHRRMLDHEYLSELAIAFLNGPQNKKDKLDEYYKLYETAFEGGELLESAFRKATDEIESLLPNLKLTRWRKKSDFYTLFLVVADRWQELPWPSDKRVEIRGRLVRFSEQIDSILRLDEEEWANANENIKDYARNVARAASDRGSRISRAQALTAYLFG